MEEKEEKKESKEQAARPRARRYRVGESETSRGNPCGQVWWETYRPQRLAEIQGQPDVSVIEEMIRHGCIPHFLFHGPPGTGKTSTALAIPNELYGEEEERETSTMTLNGSDDTSVQVMRTTVHEFVASHRFTARKKTATTTREEEKKAVATFKWIVVDEADRLTHASQRAVVRLMKRYGRVARFCFITNEPDKLIPALVSNCAPIYFMPVSREVARAKLIQVAAQQHIEVDSDAIDCIVDHAAGDLRSALGCLQFCASIEEEEEEEEKKKKQTRITRRVFYEVMAIPDPIDIATFIKKLESTDPSIVYPELRTWQRLHGFSCGSILSSFFHHVLTFPGRRTTSPRQHADLLHQLSILESRSQERGSDTNLLIHLTLIMASAK